MVGLTNSHMRNSYAKNGEPQKTQKKLGTQKKKEEEKNKNKNKNKKNYNCTNQLTFQT